MSDRDFVVTGLVVAALGVLLLVTGDPAGALILCASTTQSRHPYRPDPQALADASMTPEAALQVRVVGLARAHGWTAYHTNDSRRSEAGFPDLVLVRPPRVLFVELKVGHRQLTVDQQRWMRLLEGCTEVGAFVLRGRLDGVDDLTGFEGVLRRRGAA
ncbi:MAG TPA: VRR-NUC domain-containing protein [Candidatus Limnocylindrales bacterium]|nr:VRR-NUC domain-containing protein [Candidatus Limnocylindrales bacterium]